MKPGKTLLPELLPEPRPGNGQGPRERVTLRARAMLDRLSGLKTAAGAAVLATHCGGYGVVDPLPPPPAACTSSAHPFTGLEVSGLSVAGDGGASDARILLGNASAIGYGIAAVRVTGGGTLIDVKDMSQGGAGGGTNVWITIHPDDSGTPITFEVDLACGGAAITKYYRATFNGVGYSVIDVG